MSKGKYLAIDFGDKRVGIAISDYDKQIAFPRKVIEFKSIKNLIANIKTLCDDEQVIKIIIGLPIEMDGKMGDRFIKTHKFGDKLKSYTQEIPIEYFDERLTTKRSIHKLHEQGIKCRDQKNQIDMISAQTILEGYLDSL